jgi:hypothetical protein
MKMEPNAAPTPTVAVDAVAPQGEKDAVDTLVAVLNVIGYTEEFALAHPDLKVSEGVRLFLSQKAAQPDERAALFNQIADALYQPASLDERSAFEAWALTQDINLTRGMAREREYSYMEADHAWRIWRGVWAVLEARAASQGEKQ